MWRRRKVLIKIIIIIKQQFFSKIQACIQIDDIRIIFCLFTCVLVCVCMRKVCYYIGGRDHWLLSGLAAHTNTHTLSGVLATQFDVPLSLLSLHARGWVMLVFQAHRSCLPSSHHLCALFSSFCSSGYSLYIQKKKMKEKKNGLISYSCSTRRTTVRVTNLIFKGPARL